MATRTGPILGEALLNSPDIDDDGEIDVEYFPVPDSEGITDPALKAAWDGAMRILDARESETQDDGEPSDQ